MNMEFFEYSHLPEKLKGTSMIIGEAAKTLDDALTDGEEKEAGMRKLLEAKDCFVRAKLEEDK